MEGGFSQIQLQFEMIYSRVKLPYLTRHLPKMEAEFSKQWNLRMWIIKT